MSLKQNIIYIYFKGKHQVTSKSQYQYNHGQYLYFADLNLPQAFEVHFSNKDKGESKTQIGSDNLVEIPDEYFWNGALQIYAWIYLHSKTTDGETIYEVKIPLTKRAKPTDEEPLPVQQSTIDRAIAELNNAVDITTENANKTDSDKIIVSNIKEDVITLKENIDSTATTINQKTQETIDASERAEASAQNAATSENKALNYSQQAEQSAQSALESKNIAQQKSEVATNASNEALGYRDEALEAKNQAVQAKQNIVDYRDETKGYRDETSNLKNDVQTLKGQIEDISDDVGEDAQSASQSASSASQSANNASQFANSANQSANSASQSANQAEQFKNQSETNVTHYPKVVDGYWYVWDAVNEEYVNTNVDARGVKGDIGIGIENTVLNSDYTLTITFTDGTSYTTPSIRGEKGIKGDVGNGIASTVLNDDYTLTLTFTDGTTYTTPSIRGEKGEQGEPATDMDIHICSASEYDSETRIPTITSPDDKTFYLVPTEDGTSPDLFTEWVYVNNAWEMFGSASVDLTDYVKNTDYATDAVGGVVKVNTSKGLAISSSGTLETSDANVAILKDGTDRNSIVSARRLAPATFYGLAKVAGHDEKDSELPVGQYTDEAKASIQSMLGVPSENEVVKDVQVNGTSVTTDGVAEIPIATGNRLGVVQGNPSGGTQVLVSGQINTAPASSTDIKAGTATYKPIAPNKQHESAFYGLAKASGTDEKNSTLSVGQYTDEAKSSIQEMLDVPSNADLDEVEEKVDQNTEDLLKAFPIETASGNIASFEDGANDIPLQSLVVDINPVQDLHGYDSPWVAGGGKNLLDNVKVQYQNTIFLGTDTYESDNTHCITAPAGAYTLSVETSDGTSTNLYVAKVGETQYLARTTNAKILTFTLEQETSLRIWAYKSGYSDIGAEAITQFQLERGSTATDWTPYENICPISGWTGMQIQHTWKNCAESAFGNYVPSISNGQMVQANGWSTPFIFIDNAKNYTVSFTGSSACYVFYYDENYGFLGAITGVQVGYQLNSYTNYSSASYVKLRSDAGSGLNPHLQLELCTLTPISWQIEAGTVYGGKLDVLSGVLTVDRYYGTSAEGTAGVGIVQSDDGYFWYNTTGGFSIPSIKGANAKLVTDRFKPVVNVTRSSPDGEIAFYANNIIRWKEHGEMTLAEYKAYLADNPFTLCYELAEPITIQLTPREVNSLLGQNNIWADTGNTSVEYCADTEMYIDKVKPVVNVNDVQINGTSIVSDGVANVPVATDSVLGTIRTADFNGTKMMGEVLSISVASSSHIKGGTRIYNPVTPNRQHESTFYGLAKAAGDTTQSTSSNTVGNYTDNAKDKIQTMLGVSPLIAPHESDPFESVHAINELFIVNGKLYRAKTALTAGEYINEGTNVEVVDVAEVLDDKVGDVQVNGTSVVTDGVANIPMATGSVYGAVKFNASYGIAVNTGIPYINNASESDLKSGTNDKKPITSNREHIAIFYGLAKASGDTTQSTSSNPVGTYTDEAKTAIKQMLGVHDAYDSFVEEVTGTDVTITGQPSYRYNCGEVLSLSITPPSNGTIDIRFTSGSTPTVLTLPQTVKMPEWWVEVEANTIYEMCITDGIYCGVMTWAI